MRLEWSAEALADLDRFAEFLQEHNPGLAKAVAQAIIAQSKVLEQHPKLGRSIAGRDEYRQMVLQVLNAAYIFQYRIEGDRLVLLRVFHGRELRSGK